MNEFKHKKSLGQNFLKDNNIIQKIVNASSITEDSLIIEVGPGEGALTKELIKTNGKILAFEIDERLKDELKIISNDNLEIVFRDFLQVDLDSYLQKYNYEKLLLIANLPYYITTPIIMKVINETKIDEMIIMVQKEVGNRFRAKPQTKEYNSLSVFLQYYFEIEVVTMVSRNCFEPKPNVDSIVIKFTRKTNKYHLKNENMFFKLVRDAFMHKRKNLKNNLYEYDINKIEKVLKRFNKDLRSRAEEITLEEFIEISNEIS